MSDSKISISMMTTLSGESFKGPQMPGIIKGLKEENILGNAYGIWSSTDSKEYGKEYKQEVRTSKMLKHMFRISKRICSVCSANHYAEQEKIYGFMAGHRRYAGDSILLKPWPGKLVEKFKQGGKRIIIEASENHPRYTYEALKNECLSCGFHLPQNNHTNEKRIEEFEKSIELADYLICLSNFSTQTYLDRGFPRDKIFTTGLSVGDAFELPTIDLSQSITFVSVANHSILKGTHRLIDLWNKKGIENELLIIGCIYPELAGVLPKINNPNIKFCGTMSREDIYNIYRSRPCVHALLSISEAYGRSVYESLTKSVPQIVTPTCTCDLVKDGYNGFLVNTENTEKLEEIVEHYINMSPDEFHLMRMNTYDAVRNETSSFKDRYLSALKSCIQKEI